MTPTPTTPTTLTELAHMSSGSDHPILLLVPSDDEASSSFETHVAFPRLAAHTLGRKTETSWAENQVFVLRKRPGGAFPERIGIGRAKGSDVVVQLSGISKYHAYLGMADDNYTLTDAKSRNGTWVNGVRLSTPPHSLSNRDEVVLGSSTFLFFNTDGLRALFAEIGLH